ncbi:serine hydroxymethyltransferase, partial [Candidatus Parcubacteria bacterium]
MHDAHIARLVRAEARRQRETLNLIASENFVSRDVLAALGSPFTNKYAEGYPGARYYGGNCYADELERLCQRRALRLFGLREEEWGVNVQPYSGSPANLAVYLALVPRGGKIMGMRLDMGGHLTHGHHVSATGKFWTPVHYGVKKGTERLCYKTIARLAAEEKPKLIVTGYTAYPRRINFQKFRAIADSVGALLLVDMSHIAGLVAAGVHPSPFPFADVVTTTTHKTLRGPRAALIFAKKELLPKINKAVFPGLQGGPHLNQIAAVAVALHEAGQASFRAYGRRVVRNAAALAAALQKEGWRIVTGGTDTHLLLVDVAARGISGKTAETRLERCGIVANKNTIPYDSRAPADPSGIRMGTASLTTRGMGVREMRTIA